MHARYYSSDLGRFLSVDPVGGTAGSSQSWNRYSYVLNSPLRLIDPSGQSTAVAEDRETRTIHITWIAEFHPGTGGSLSEARRMARAIERRVEEAWSGTVTDDEGVEWTVVTDAHIVATEDGGNLPSADQVEVGTSSQWGRVSKTDPGLVTSKIATRELNQIRSSEFLLTPSVQKRSSTVFLSTLEYSRGQKAIGEHEYGHVLGIGFHTPATSRTDVMSINSTKTKDPRDFRLQTYQLNWLREVAGAQRGQ